MQPSPNNRFVFDDKAVIVGGMSVRAARHGEAALDASAIDYPLANPQAMELARIWMQFDAAAMPKLYGVVPKTRGTSRLICERLSPRRAPRDWPELRADLVALLELIRHASALGLVLGDLEASQVLSAPDGRLVVIGFRVASPDERADVDGGILHRRDLMAVATVARQFIKAASIPLGQLPEELRLWLEVGAGPTDATAFHWATRLRQLDPALPPRPSIPGLTQVEAWASAPWVDERPPRLIGRVEERNVLRQVIGEVAAEPGGKTVLLHGPLGVGKSRIARCVVQGVRSTDRAHVLHVRHRANGGFGHGLEAALRDKLAIDGDSIDIIHRRCARYLADRGEERQDLARLLAALVNETESLTTALRLQALMRTLQAIAKAKPLILWIENAQWAEQTLLAWRAASELAEASGTSMLAIVEYRPTALINRPNERSLIEEFERRGAVSLPVEALSREESAAMARDAYGLCAEQATRLAGRCDGNPLFMKQWIEAAFLAGDIELGGDGVHLAPPRLRTPPSNLLESYRERVIAAFATKSANRRRDALLGLGAIAYLGSSVRLREWFKVCGILNIGHPTEILSLAANHQLLHRSTSHIAFEHGLTAQVMRAEVSRMSADDMVQAACGEALSALFRDGDREVAQGLATYLLREGRHQEAVPPLLAWCERLIETRNVKLAAQALGHTQSVLAVCEQDEMSANSVEAKVLENEFAHLERRPPVHPLETLIEHCEDQGWLRLGTRAKRLVAHHHARVGNHAAALKAYIALAESCRNLHLDRVAADCYARAAAAQESLGRIREAKTSLIRGLELVSDMDAGDMPVRIGLLLRQAALASRGENYEPALHQYGEAQRLASGLGRIELLGQILTASAHTLVAAKRLHQAFERFGMAATALGTVGSTWQNEPLLGQAIVAMLSQDVEAVARLAARISGDEATHLAAYGQALELWVKAQKGDVQAFDEAAVPLLRSDLPREREFGLILSLAGQSAAEGEANNGATVQALGDALQAKAAPRPLTFTGL